MYERELKRQEDTELFLGAAQLSMVIMGFASVITAFGIAYGRENRKLDLDLNVNSTLITRSAHKSTLVTHGGSITAECSASEPNAQLVLKVDGEQKIEGIGKISTQIDAEKLSNSPHTISCVGEAVVTDSRSLFDIHKPPTTKTVTKTASETVYFLK